MWIIILLLAGAYFYGTSLADSVRVSYAIGETVVITIQKAVPAVLGPSEALPYGCV